MSFLGLPPEIITGNIGIGLNRQTVRSALAGSPRAPASPAPEFSKPALKLPELPTPASKAPKFPVPALPQHVLLPPDFQKPRFCCLRCRTPAPSTRAT